MAYFWFNHHRDSTTTETDRSFLSLPPRCRRRMCHRRRLCRCRRLCRPSSLPSSFIVFLNKINAIRFKNRAIQFKISAIRIQNSVVKFKSSAVQLKNNEVQLKNSTVQFKRSTIHKTIQFIIVQFILEYNAVQFSVV